MLWLMLLPTSLLLQSSVSQGYPWLAGDGYFSSGVLRAGPTTDEARATGIPASCVCVRTHFRRSYAGKKEEEEEEGPAQRKKRACADGLLQDV